LTYSLGFQCPASYGHDSYTYRYQGKGSVGSKATVKTDGRRDTTDRITMSTNAVGNKSVFSHVRMLTTWHCPHSPAAAAAIDLLPAGHTAANPQQRRPTAGTDRLTDTVPLHRPCHILHVCEQCAQVSMADHATVVQHVACNSHSMYADCDRSRLVHVNSACCQMSAQHTCDPTATKQSRHYNPTLFACTCKRLHVGYSS